MKQTKSFNIGDQVFAKIKGYPPWPAKVESVNGKKYVVKFYGTGEIGNVKVEEIFYYLKHKKQFTKPLKRKDYNDAINEIEQAISEAGGDGGDTVDDANDSSVLNTPTTETPIRKGKRKISQDSESSLSKGTQESVEDLDESDVDSHTAKDTPKAKGIKRSKIEKTPRRISNEKSTNATETPESETKPVSYEKYLVSDKTLQYCIKYADHVRKDEDYYKDLPVEEPTFEYKHIILPVELPSGTVAGIKLTKDWPVKLKSEFDRAIFDEELAKAGLELRDQILSGSKTVDDDKSIISDINMTEDSVKQIFKNIEVQNKQNRVDQLKREAKLVDLDTKIKLCLGLETADPKEAIGYLQEMLELDANQLLLKKHPHIVDMVRRLRHYIGNTKEWNLSEESLEEFKQLAEQIQKKSEQLYNSFTKLFKNTKKECQFWDYFTAQMKEFQEECKDLTESQVCVLCAPPRSRKTFMTQLEELENAESQDADNSNDIEKENSSGIANAEQTEEIVEEQQS